MFRFRWSLAILVLVAIQLFVEFVLSDYLTERGLAPKETTLVAILAVSCFLLGVVVMMVNDRVSKKKKQTEKQDKTP